MTRFVAALPLIFDILPVVIVAETTLRSLSESLDDFLALILKQPRSTVTFSLPTDQKDGGMSMFINGASEEAVHGWFMGLKQCDDQHHVSQRGTTHHNKVIKLSNIIRRYPNPLSIAMRKLCFTHIYI